MPDTELQLAISQLFSSPLCEQLLASCVREICLTRRDVARDVLLLICLLQHGEVNRITLVNIDLSPAYSKLLLSLSYSPDTRSGTKPPKLFLIPNVLLSLSLLAKL